MGGGEGGGAGRGDGVEELGRRVEGLKLKEGGRWRRGFEGVVLLESSGWLFHVDGDVFLVAVLFERPQGVLRVTGGRAFSTRIVFVVTIATKTGLVQRTPNKQRQRLAT